MKKKTEDIKTWTRRDSKSWEMGNRWCEPHRCPSYCLERVSGLWHREGWHWRTMVVSPSWGDRGRDPEKQRLSEFARRGMQRGQLHREMPHISRGPPLSLQQSADLKMNEGQWKNHLEGLKETVLGVHAGLRIMPIANYFLFTLFPTVKKTNKNKQNPRKTHSIHRVLRVLRVFPL